MTTPAPATTPAAALPAPAAATDATEDRRAALVERADALFRDLELGAVRRWKEAHGGAQAIGFMPVYAPRELIHAAGLLPVGILGGGDMVEIVKGDAYYQSYICHLPRSTIELALNGSYAPLDGMIFPSICDVIRNLSGMWQIMFPDKYVRYLDVPQNYDDAIGGDFYVRELTDLRHDLERLAGRPLTDDALRASITLYNENRRLVTDLYALRTKAPWLVPSAELYLVVRAANVLPVEEHTALLRDYLEVARASRRRPMDMARVVIRGCFCEQPPFEMIRTLERAGCYIVDDDWVLTTRWPEGDVPTDGDPLVNLVKAYIHKCPECPSMFVAEGRKGDVLVRRVRETGAEGVLFTAASFCDPALLDQPMAVDAVKRAGIPYATFLFSETTGQFQVIREQAGTFADSIKLA